MKNSTSSCNAQNTKQNINDAIKLAASFGWSFAEISETLKTIKIKK